MAILPTIPKSNAVQGRLLDIYTRKGGMGLGQPGGTFTQGEEVQLIANVTYNGQPVQQKLVGFEVQNPLNISVVLRSAVTDEDGLCSISFKIPILPENVGTWTAIAIVEIAQETSFDTITFIVKLFRPVGGFSVSTKRDQNSLLVSYNLVIISLILSLVAVKRKARRFSNQKLVAESSFS
jgi:NADH:ubiquinone oxidoreductase subunit K